MIHAQTRYLLYIYFDFYLIRCFHSDSNVTLLIITLSSPPSSVTQYSSITFMALHQARCRKSNCT